MVTRDTTSFRTAKIVAGFSALAAALYAVAYVYPSPSVWLFLWVAPLIAVIQWVERDAARTGVASVHDLGFLLWFSWPVVIPWYTWKTRGWSGLRLSFFLFALIWSAQLSWFVVAWLTYAARYAIWYARWG